MQKEYRPNNINIFENKDNGKYNNVTAQLKFHNSISSELFFTALAHVSNATLNLIDFP